MPKNEIINVEPVIIDAEIIEDDKPASTAVAAYLMVDGEPVEVISLPKIELPVIEPEVRGFVEKTVFIPVKTVKWQDGQIINDDGTAFNGNGVVSAVAGAFKWLFGLVRKTKKEIV